ncbi:XRE family transcriptional regulator [bacterium]|nr:XRE family transcriptional regulator [bacterium]QQR58316.1 MAG: XRE family transcriptional regulator [Candidatus Melainabacteria bacterium]
MPKSNKSGSKPKTRKKVHTKPVEEEVEMEVGCGNVFRDLGFSVDQSASFQARCDLLRALQQLIEKNGWTQAEAAKRLKVGQPRIAEILHSQSKLFSTDLLIKYLARLGVQVDFKFSKIDWA